MKWVNVNYSKVLKSSGTLTLREKCPNTEFFLVRNKKIAFRIFQMITKFMYGAKETQVGEVFT